MKAAGIAHALRGGRRSGEGWVACCPAHDGHVIVHCHAGCAQAAVITALKELGLWPDREKRPQRRCVVAEYRYTDDRSRRMSAGSRSASLSARGLVVDGPAEASYMKHRIEGHTTTTISG